MTGRLRFGSAAAASSGQVGLDRRGIVLNSGASTNGKITLVPDVIVLALRNEI